MRASWISILVAACAGPPDGYPELVGCPPGQFVLVSPQDTATNVDSAPTFFWNEAKGATSYRFQLAQSSTFEAPDVDVELMDTFAYDSLRSATTYYWRVTAENQEGTRIAGPFSFTTR
jgi:hypothetical protein